MPKFSMQGYDEALGQFWLMKEWHGQKCYSGPDIETALAAWAFYQKGGQTP